MATSLNVKPVEIVKPVKTIKCTLMFRIAQNVKPVQIINSTTKFKPALNHQIYLNVYSTSNRLGPYQS